MKFVFHNYEHPENEVDYFLFSQTPIYVRNERIGATYRITARGQILGSTQAELNTAIGNLIDQYQVTYPSQAGLKHDDGTVTRHFLYANDFEAMSPIKVIRRHWPESNPGEYATKRTFEVVIEQQKFETGAYNTLSFVENLTFCGDNSPIYEVQLRRDAPPRIEQVNQNSEQRIIQSGQAIGFLAQPTIPDKFSIFTPGTNFIYHPDRSKISRWGPDWNGYIFTNYGVSWNYQFTSTLNDQSAVLPNRG